MYKVVITSMDGMFGRDQSEEFKKFGLQIGDKIEVTPFINNAVFYQPKKDGDVLFIYIWNIKAAN